MAMPARSISLTSTSSGPSVTRSPSRVVVHVLGAAVGEADLAHVELVAHEVEVGIDLGRQRAPCHHRDALERLARSQTVSVARGVAEAHDALHQAHALLELGLVPTRDRPRPGLEMDA
jgi:hypothetical protein